MNHYKLGSETNRNRIRRLIHRLPNLWINISTVLPPQINFKITNTTHVQEVNHDHWYPQRFSYYLDWKFSMLGCSKSFNSFYELQFLNITTVWYRGVLLREQFCPHYAERKDPPRQRKYLYPVWHHINLQYKQRNIFLY